MKNNEEYLEVCGGIPMIDPLEEMEEGAIELKRDGEAKPNADGTAIESSGKNIKEEKNDTDTDGAKEDATALNNDTELVFIIDESGSMSGFEADTVGGFNSMIKKQKEGEGKVYVSTVLFNTVSRVVHDRIDIKSINLMEEKDYLPGGCTALLDAIGGSIRHISNIHKYARREDVPKNTIFVITTDGMENSSRNYDSDKVKSMIKEYTEKYGWEFIFVAANIDAVETARHIGIRPERAANYEQSSVGVEACYEAMSMFVSRKRMAEEFEDDMEWKKKLF